MTSAIFKRVPIGSADIPPAIRVCVVVASLDILGGQAVQAVRLLEGLAREPGVDAELLPINPRLLGPLRRLQRVKYVRTLVTSILYLWTLLRRLPKCSVVHVYSAAYFSFMLAPAPAILIAKLLGKRVLLNYHSGEAEDHLRRWRRVALPIIRLADRVVVPSGYLVDVFARFGIKAEAVFNTVDPDRFKYRARGPVRPVLLSNRNLERHYRVDSTLRAFALIQHQVPEARLIVAGDGSELARLQALAAELDLGRVEFVGAVAPERMPALYEQAEIFINSSEVDNMPLSIIEAFAAGLPVVTTNAGGIPYLVADGETGLMVPCGDEEALATGVLRLLGDGHLAADLVRAAYQESHRYTWGRVREEWLRLYREMSGGGSTERAGRLTVRRSECDSLGSESDIRPGFTPPTRKSLECGTPNRSWGD